MVSWVQGGFKVGNSPQRLHLTHIVGGGGRRAPPWRIPFQVRHIKACMDGVRSAYITSGVPTYGWIRRHVDARSLNDPHMESTPFAHRCKAQVSLKHGVDDDRSNAEKDVRQKAGKPN